MPTSTAYRLLDKKAADREAEHEAFHAMIAARTKGAGTKALDDNRAMLEREDRLMRELQERMVSGYISAPRALALSRLHIGSGRTVRFGPSTSNAMMAVCYWLDTTCRIPVSTRATFPVSRMLSLIYLPFPIVGPRSSGESRC